MKIKIRFGQELLCVLRNRYLKKSSYSIQWGGKLVVLLMLLSFSQIQAQLPNDFQKVELLTGLANATTMKFAPDGRIFIVDRYGELLIYKSDTQTTVSAGVLPVFHGFEDGFLGLAFDPEFAVNQKIYIYYSLPSTNKNRISQFSMNGDLLDLSSEVPMMEWNVQRTNSFHAGGDMAFDSQGNLYIAVGDNTNHGLYGALDENNVNNSAEKSSSHTNDYRGKILRIKPNASNGSYSIPAGNLFPPGTPSTLPEIYVMGARNPYRIFVDKENNDWLFWGEVGPDANSSGTMGPEGLDEINLTKTAGNYGWPYFSGVDNDAYQVPYKTPSPFYNNPAAPENTSVWNKAPNNIGATILPPAEPAWLEFFHKSYFAGPRYYYDGTATDPQRLPVEFDGVFFYYDFNTSKIWAVKMDATGNILSNEQLAPAVFPSSKNGFIDMKIGPDGHMYILEYGTGCCPQNAGTGKLVRVDFTGISTNSPPSVVINTDVTSGSVPLTVNFTSAGTVDPNGDTPLTYAWDFQTDGIVDATTEDASFTFTSAGTYNVQLKVDDGNGGIGVQNVTINAGNNAATFTFNSPPDGGFVGWGDDITIDLVVNDQEDGSTGSGIDCADVSVVPSLGHLNHFHDGATVDGCPRILTLQYEGHDIDGGADIFYVLGTNYTDQGGLQAFDQIKLHPKRKEAEYYDTQSGVEIIQNTDPLLGGEEAIRVDNNSYISFLGRNLLHIESVRYRVASTLAGGTIEFRSGSSTGPLIATTIVPSTGSLDTWVNIESTFTGPVGKHDLFFIFKSSSAAQDIFDVNFVEFVGAGVSIDNSPPLVNKVTSLSATEVQIEFSEYMSQASAETLSNYVINNGISVTGATLLDDGRSVLLSVSTMSSNNSYNLTVSNAQNVAGLPVTTGSYPFSILSSVRVNVGGPQVTLDSHSFEGDQYFSGGSLYTAAIPIAETNDDALYQTERFGAFTYEIPVPVSGEYDIRLHFAELYFGVGSQAGGPGSRVFNVNIEGNPVLTNFDILAETDPATALQKEFDNVSVTDGFATIQLLKITENAKLSGIEILPPSAFDPVPAVSITSPTNGANVNLPFEVNFSVENWTIQEGGTHMHYYIDGEMVGPHYSYGPITIDGLSLGNHSIRLELYEVGHVPTGIFHEITVNVTEQGVCNSTPFPDAWAVHQLEANPYTAVYTLPDHDLDGDGLKDIVTGGWWYKNPGSASGNWVKSTIGGGFGNVVHVYDFDGDGHMDLLGTALGSGSGNQYKSAQLLWAKNDGSGNFTVYTNIPAGDTNYVEPFLAGIAGGNFGLGNPYQMAINWNGAESTGSPVQLLTPTADPTTGTWSLIDLSNDSSGEDIKAGDIDGDGDLDLFQGVNWLRNEGNGSWTTFSTGITYTTTPDRVQLADFNGDGRLDAVVGQLGIGGSNSNKSEIAWFEAPVDPTQPWLRHVLSTSVTGSLSVTAIDIDLDGDKDIVVGEWLGSRRLIAFENDLCNTGNWTTHILDDGALNLEHHDGAMVTDIDNDGDLDVISNGWINHKVPRIYENTTLSPGNQDPIANAGEDQTISLPTNSITFNGTGTDPDGGTVSFLWTQVSGPNTATLSGAATSDLTASDLLEGDYVFRLTVTDDETDTAFDEVGVTVLPEPTGSFALRINAGGPQTTYGGNEFGADQYFDVGNTLDRPQTGLSQPYRTIRYSSSGVMGYDIPVPNGEYTVILHFAETWFGATSGGAGGIGSRVFDVSIEGQVVEDNLDVFAQAGGAQTMLLRSHTVTVTGGILDIDFSSLASVGGVRHPIINAIEVLGNGSASSPPIANAGTDQTISLPGTSSATFNGIGTDPDGGAISSYQWTQFSGPNTASLSGENTADLTVTGLVAGSYVFRLMVTDDQNETGTDDVTLIVQSGGGSDPIAGAGTDQTISLPTNSITFNGTGNDPDGSTVSFLWTQVSGPNTATLSGAATSDLTASNLLEGDYVFRLTVTDDETNTAFDEVGVTVLPEPTGSFALRINAGGPQTTYGGNEFGADQYFDVGNTLDRPQTGLSQPYRTIRYSSSGVMGYDIPVPNGEYTVILHFAETWFGATSGGAGGIGSRVFDVSIEGQVVEDNLDVFAQAGGAQTMLLRSHTVTVTGGILDIDFSSLASVGGVRHPIINAIEVLGNGSASSPPIANAGTDQTISLPGTSSATFNGIGTDPDGGAISSYQWTQFSGPNTASLSGENTADLTVTGLVAGNYVFRLMVTDDQNETGTDDVTLIVQSGGGSDPIANAGTDQTISLPTNSITFNGTGTDPDGGTVSFLWTQVSGPNTATLSGDSTSDLTASNLLEGDYVFRLTVTDDETDTAFDEVRVTVLPEPTGSFALRINAGGPQTTYGGNEFGADQYFDVGNTLDRPQTGLSQPYRTIRYSPSRVMGYDIPVPNGEYTVILHFAETWFGATSGGAGGVGSRVFDVSIEGQVVEDNLDVFAQAGGAQTMLLRSHTVTVTGGILDIDFSSLASVGGVRHPIINAIEVLGNGSSAKQASAAKEFDDISTIFTAREVGGSELFPERTQLIQIAPNPAKYEVEVMFSDTSANIMEFTIHDVGGKLVERTKSSESQLSPGNNRFDISHLENGMYIINIITSDGNSTRHKLIINK